MKYLDKWFNDLGQRSVTDLSKPVTATGEYRRFISPRKLYASVELEISPYERLEVADELDDQVRTHMEQAGWYDQILFGVLDVLLTSWPSPVKQFHLLIKGVDFNEIESTAIAFRLAAREAAIMVLKSQ